MALHNLGQRYPAAPHCTQCGPWREVCAGSWAKRRTNRVLNQETEEKHHNQAKLFRWTHCYGPNKTLMTSFHVCSLLQATVVKTLSTWLTHLWLACDTDTTGSSYLWKENRERNRPLGTQHCESRSELIALWAFHPGFTRPTSGLLVASPSHLNPFTRVRIEAIGWGSPLPSDCFLLFQCIACRHTPGRFCFLKAAHRVHSMPPPQASFVRQWGTHALDVCALNSRACHLYVINT